MFVGVAMVEDVLVLALVKDAEADLEKDTRDHVHARVLGLIVAAEEEEATDLVQDLVLVTEEGL
jgi:hypothetical protein